ncbi:MAG: multidrug effflux MFS transporter [Kistimonas sp.]|nr:multidrug effflux MFS transporter [Kistimonas sp.]
MQTKNTQTNLLPIIVMMSVVGLMATDIYIPAMPSIAKHFAITDHGMQLTLAGYLLGLSVSQLAYGPLSDHFGRKPIVFAGMLLFTLATLACSFATSGFELIVFRCLQGIGACAGLTIGRAIIGDIYSKEQTGKIFATVFPFVGLSPAIAPVIGGYVNSLYGWHSVFGLLFVFGFVLVVVVFFKLPETKEKEHRIAIRATTVAKTYASLVFSMTFWGYVLVPCFAYIAYFGYISESSFVFSKQGYTSSQIGYFYIALSITYLAGNLLSKRFLNHMSLNRALLSGYVVFVAGALLMLLMNSSGSFYAMKIWLPMAVLTLGNGFLLPLGAAGVIANFKEKSGYASGLLGFLQLGSASVSSLAVGFFSQADAFRLSLYLSACCLLGFFLFVLFLRIQSRGYIRLDPVA